MIVEVKVCGITKKKDAELILNAGAKYLGFILFKKSPRHISIENASILQKRSENLKINGVGVFVNKNINELEKIIKTINLRFVQLHGSEDESYIQNIKNSGVNVIKSIPIKDKNDLINIDRYKSADYYLFDYKPMKGELPGGNAKNFDWEIIKNFKTNKPWFLSGGINIKNIQEILHDINPFGIDLSSGVEKELGIKDNHIINNLIDKLKNA